MMRLHCAAERLRERACPGLPGIERIGAHIAEDKARIGVGRPTTVAPQILGTTDRVCLWVDADPAIRSDWRDRGAGRRFRVIQRVERVPRGGTHPRRTEEAGPIVLKRKNVGSHKERLEIRLLT